MSTSCYIGLGSNLGDGKATLESAISDLKRHPAIELKSHSQFYSSKPHGPQNQPDYVNAVACVETDLPAMQLLHTLFEIEKAHDRVRNPDIHWGPRTLDLDLLLYGNEVIDEPDLKVPHPFMRERSFVIYPLYELAPDLVLPNGTSLESCKQNLAGDDLFVMA